MKVFWSWQSDTPGKTGRHFVRKCLAAAIAELREPEDVEEPTQRETREELHLDHDRQGVSGSPDLANTILEKISNSSVFVCDMTLVAENVVTEGDGKERRKRLINSNVAIEYGFALRHLSDKFILMVQNAHYGERDALPFDLRHKAGPISYRLAPDASGGDIKKVAAELTAVLVSALRPYLKAGGGDQARVEFQRTPATQSPALFAARGEVIARYGTDLNRVFGHSEDDDAQQYTFDETTAFYLRLIPTKPLAAPIKRTTLDQMMNARKFNLPTRNAGAPLTDRNAYGAIGYEPSGTNPTPVGFTQLFQNGEVWGVNREVFAHYPGGDMVLMPNVPVIAKQTLENWVQRAMELGVELPVEVEIGLVGIEGYVLPRDRRGSVTARIRRPQCILTRVVYSPDAVQQVVEEFNAELWDLAGSAPP